MQPSRCTACSAPPPSSLSSLSERPRRMQPKMREGNKFANSCRDNGTAGQRDRQGQNGAIRLAGLCHVKDAQRDDDGDADMQIIYK